MADLNKRCEVTMVATDNTDEKCRIGGWLTGYTFSDSATGRADRDTVWVGQGGTEPNGIRLMRGDTITLDDGDQPSVADFLAFV
jgi:hypothetical protein